jgi:hypothetical protein
MTLIHEPLIPTPAATGSDVLTYDRVTFDLYRDIHKAIRSELFAVTEEAGRTDPSDRLGRQALFGHVAEVMGLLEEHAEHEDGAIGPVLDRELPDLQARIVVDHEALERRIEGLRDHAAAAVAAPDGQPRRDLHRLYVELASFTSAYLAHQDLEERVVMPALEEAVGVEQVMAIHGAIVGPMPPDQMARSVALMLPAMNIDDRTEFLQGMAAGAPPEVVDGVWGLAGTVLAPADLAALAHRLGR